LEPIRRAESLHRKHRTNCPFKIAKILNITIMYLDLPIEVKGYSRRVLKRKIIVINSNLEEDEQYFVCAHELGHIILHKGVSHYFITTHTFVHVGRYEREAHTFALYLLISGDSLAENESVQALLTRNRVPEEMARYY